MDGRNIARFPFRAANGGLYKQVFRFAGAGVINTALTFVLYQLLLFALSPSVAYALTWLVGLSLVVAVYPAAVFGRSETSSARRAAVAATYLLGFVIGLLVLRATIAWADAPRAAILASLAATSAFNFLVMRLVLSDRPT